MQARKKAPVKGKIAKKPAQEAAKKSPENKEARPALTVPEPTMGAVLGMLIAANAKGLAEAAGRVDWERVARLIVGYDWRSGHFSRICWDRPLAPLDAGAAQAARKVVPPLIEKKDIKGLARAFRAIDWKALLGKAPLGSVQWSGDVFELVVSLYNCEKAEIVCPMCPYPYRSLFGRLFRAEREISGREVPLLCQYEGDRGCPPDFAQDSWTRLDDLTGQDGRSVRTDGLADRCVTKAKIGFDLSEVPEGGGCIAMREGERERLHAQHAGRVPAEPAGKGVFMVGLAGFRSADSVQVVASSTYTRGDGTARKPAVADWELNPTNTEITFRVHDENGEPLLGDDVFVTIDWIATTR